MNVVTGELWQELGRADLLLITTNAVVTARGKLVMGREAAYEAAQRFQNLPSDLGRQLLEKKLNNGTYGVLISGESYLGTRLGAFQTKVNYKDDSTIELIKTSCQHLVEVAQSYKRVAMNYPGVGLGKLSEDEVLPILSQLPDNVFVYKKSG